MPKRETVISQNNTTVNAPVQYSGTFVFKKHKQKTIVFNLTQAK